MQLSGITIQVSGAEPERNAKHMDYNIRMAWWELVPGLLIMSGWIGGKVPIYLWEPCWPTGRTQVARLRNLCEDSPKCGNYIGIYQSPPFRGKFVN